MPTKWTIKEDAFLLSNTEDKYIIYGIIEIVSYKMGLMLSPSNWEEDTKTFDFLYQNTEPHPGLYEVQVERFEMLKPLLQIGLISLHEFQKLVAASEITQGKTN